jgi:serine/threonine protein kinase
VLNAVNKPAAATAAPGPFGRFYLQELINSGAWPISGWLPIPMAKPRLATAPRAPPLQFRRPPRFVRGAEILSHIHDHPGIIGYVEHGKAGGLLYLLMEYVEPRTFGSCTPTTIQSCSRTWRKS